MELRQRGSWETGRACGGSIWGGMGSVGAMEGLDEVWLVLVVRRAYKRI